MSVSKLFKAELVFNLAITFKEALKRFPTLTRSNFDKIKSLYRKELRELENPLPSKKAKKRKKSKSATNTDNKRPKTFLANKEQLKTMSIKAKIKMTCEATVDRFLETGLQSKMLPKALDVLMDKEFIEQGEIVRGRIYWTSETPPYERPPFLYDHQKTAMKLMGLGHFLWQASRQLAGKTTIGLLQDFEDMLDNDDYTVALVSPSRDLSRELLNKWLYSPIKYKGKIYRFYDIIRPYLKKEPTADGFTLKNGSRLMILSLKYSSSQGRTINVIHIEELDKLTSEKSKREGLAGLIGSLRANPLAMIRCFSNNLTGIFRLLKAELFKFGRYFSIFLEDPFAPEDDYSGAHTIVNEDVIVDRIPKLDEILLIFYEILVSEAFALGQLYNIDLATDEVFNPDKVEKAYNHPKAKNTPNFIKTVMGIDPGGKVDSLGISIWGKRKSGEVELCWAKRFNNATHEAKEMAKIVAENYIRYHCENCQSESNSGAGWLISLIADEVNKQSDGSIRFRSEYANFEGEGKKLDKNNFVYLFKILLDFERMILHQRNKEERALHHQITLYIIKKSESNNNPDDLIESGLHGIWNLLGGWKYVKEITDQITTTIGATTQA